MDQCECWTCDQESPFQNPLVLRKAESLQALGIAPCPVPGSSDIRFHGPLFVDNLRERPIFCVVSDANPATLNGTMYRLQQFHWHSPAEHVVEADDLLHANRADLELHWVFRSLERQHVCVVAAQFRQQDQDDPLVQDFLERNQMGVPEVSRRFFAATGSLTSKPFRTIQWLVFADARAVSAASLLTLRKRGYLQPARPLQERNARMILFVD